MGRRRNISRLDWPCRMSGEGVYLAYRIRALRLRRWLGKLICPLQQISLFAFPSLWSVVIRLFGRYAKQTPSCPESVNIYFPLLCHILCKYKYSLSFQFGNTFVCRSMKCTAEAIWRTGLLFIFSCFVSETDRMTPIGAWHSGEGKKAWSINLQQRKQGALARNHGWMCSTGGKEREV